VYGAVTPRGVQNKAEVFLTGRAGEVFGKQPRF